MTIILIIFGGYLLLLFGLAFWSRRDSHSISGYYLAERKLPWWVVAFSTNATGESGWLLLGLTGMGYAVGAQALWVVLGETVGIFLAWTLVSRRLKRVSDDISAVTVPDVLVSVLGDKRHILRLLSIIIILSMVLTYVAAQLAASGKAFNGFMDIDYEFAVLVGAAVVVGYTFFGGHKAVAYTDFVQGLLMLASLILIPAVAISALGGWTAMTDALREIDPGLLSLYDQTAGLPGWIAIIGFLAVGLPFLGVPQLLVRFMSARSEADLTRARTVSVFVIILFDVGAVLTGMAGRALFPGLADPEVILPLLSTELLPAVISGLVLVTILAAIMSTADSLLLLASSAVVRDFVQHVRGSKRTDRQLAGYGKLVTVIIGAGATAVAITEVPVIFWFVLFSWSGLGAAFGPVILCLLMYRKTTLPGAVAGMLGGFATVVLWVLVFKDQAYELYEMIPGFLAGLALTLLVSRLTYAFADSSPSPRSGGYSSQNWTKKALSSVRRGEIFHSSGVSHEHRKNDHDIVSRPHKNQPARDRFAGCGQPRLFGVPASARCRRIRPGRSATDRRDRRHRGSTDVEPAGRPDGRHSDEHGSVATPGYPERQ